MNIGDSIELIRDIPERNLFSGMQGTIVDCHPEAYEVEFINSDGETIDFLSLKPEQFIVIWKIDKNQEVSSTEQAIELIKMLPAQLSQQVLDFTRFLLSKNQKTFINRMKTSQQ